LSVLLGKPTAAITVGDVLPEISCAQTNVTLLHNLQYGNFFSSRPLIQIPSPNSNSTSRIGQIYRDGNAYFSVKLIEKFVPGWTSTFMIQNKFYTYQNYTKSSRHRVKCLVMQSQLCHCHESDWLILSLMNHSSHVSLYRIFHTIFCDIVLFLVLRDTYRLLLHIIINRKEFKNEIQADFFGANETGLITISYWLHYLLHYPLMYVLMYS